MPAQFFEQLGEAVRIGSGRLIVIAHVGVDDGGTRLDCGVGALDLLGDGDRNRRIVFLARQATGDGDADDAGLAYRSSSEGADAAAVDAPDGRRHEGGKVGGEEDDDVGDLFRVT